MGSIFQEADFTTRLAQERSRLVRLCAWFTGNPQAAEDLAQETLLAAWKNQDQLSAPEKLKPWLSAIARNVCLNWSRKHSREQAGMVQSIEAADDWYEGVLQDGASLELEQEKVEQARLLGQALDQLPAHTSQLLIEHYFKGSSHAEIAGKMGLKTDTVAVRLQRAKLTLKRVLWTRFEKESLAFGRLQQGSTHWEATNIWCPRCGQRRLLGQFEKDSPEARFFLRCSHCLSDPKSILVGFDLTRPYYAGFLGSTKTYKPAYTRLITGLASYYQRALTNHHATCPVCDRPVVVHLTHGKMPSGSSSREGIGVRIHCPTCDWATNTSLAGLVIALPEVQRFWRKYPRIRTLSTQEIEVQGLPAYVTRLQSLSGAAEIEVISRRDTLTPIGVHTNVHL